MMLYILDSGPSSQHQLYWIESDLSAGQFKVLLEIVQEHFPEFVSYFVLGHCKDFVWRDEEERKKSLSPIELVFLPEKERPKGHPGIWGAEEPRVVTESRSRIKTWRVKAQQLAAEKYPEEESLRSRRVMDF